MKKIIIGIMAIVLAVMCFCGVVLATDYDEVLVEGTELVSEGIENLTIAVPDLLPDETSDVCVTVVQGEKETSLQLEITRLNDDIKVKAVKPPKAIAKMIGKSDEKLEWRSCYKNVFWSLDYAITEDGITFRMRGISDKWNEWKETSVVTEASCNQNKVVEETRTSAQGKVQTRTVEVEGTALEHDWELKNTTTTPKTCQSPGNICRKYTCKNCGQNKTENEGIPAGHEYVTKYDASGHYQECTVCGNKTESEAHNWYYIEQGKTVHEGTCEECGTAQDHIGCTECDYEFWGTEYYTEYGDHDYTIEKRALEEEVCGEECHYQNVKVCSVCNHEEEAGEPYSETVDHDWVEVENSRRKVSDGSCTEPEHYTVGYKCSRCGETKTEDEYGRIPGHSLTCVSVSYNLPGCVEPTCTEVGYGYKHYACINCDYEEDGIELEEIPALGHNYVRDTAYTNITWEEHPNHKLVYDINEQSEFDAINVNYKCTYFARCDHDGCTASDFVEGELPIFTKVGTFYYDEIDDLTECRGDIYQCDWSDELIYVAREHRGAIGPMV